MFDDRLEIFSPGSLPNIVTLENIRETRYSRNPRIARILSEFGWVKEMNEGVKRIYTEMENFFLKSPQYSEPSNSVLLVLENNILNRNVRIDERIENIIDNVEYHTLTYVEKEIIKYSFMNKKIKSKDVSLVIGKGKVTTSKLLKSLADKNILEWYGTSTNDPQQYYLRV